MTVYLRTKFSFSSFSEILVLFMIFFLTLLHFFSCIWIFMARVKISFGDKNNWIDQTEAHDFSDFALYVTSSYFCITTITTVGYGDISGFSEVEKIFCIFLMVSGVLAFSFSTSSLSQLL